jgi:hypothetical protein
MKGKKKIPCTQGMFRYGHKQAFTDTAKKKEMLWIFSRFEMLLKITL